jgi:DNA polymerase/3'-5' exonuclease PolX
VIISFQIFSHYVNHAIQKSTTNMKKEYPYKEASELAISLCVKLSPFCTKINIAGSIRRKKPIIGDIEIVCLPKFDITYNTDLFMNKTSVYGVQIGFVRAVEALGTIEKGTPYGKYLKIVLPEGINLDLFIPNTDDFFRQYAIRTGSADYAHKILANGWRKLGWVGSDLGLRREEDCIETKIEGGKSKWTCIRNKQNKPPAWQSELEFFNWINVNFVKPEFRNIQ